MHAHAQMTIIPQIPPVGIITKNQLWNVMINSQGGYSAVSISLSLSDAATGNIVLSGVSKVVSIYEGNNQYDFSTLSPVNYTYQSSEFGSNPDGFVMAGSYVACYSIGSGTHGEIMEECVPVVVEPTSPPLLNTPYDGEEIPSPIPNFSWLPPLPLEIFSYLNYHFKLVEVQPGQNQVDAIQQNMPIYASSQNEPFLYYPSSAITLDTGKLYAWQVVANNNSQYASSSEVWSFTVAKNNPDDTSIINNGLFLRLKNYSDGTVAQCINQLHVAYANYSNDPSVQYVIKRVTESDQPIILSGELKLKEGLNLLSIPQTGNLENEKIYLFQISNSRNEVWSIKFQFQTAQD